MLRPALIASSAGLKGKIAEVELTNVNAIVDTIVAPKAAAREVAPEIAIYERVKRAYAIVQTGELQAWSNFVFKKGVIPPDP